MCVVVLDCLKGGLVSQLLGERNARSECQFDQNGVQESRYDSCACCVRLICVVVRGYVVDRVMWRKDAVLEGWSDKRAANGGESRGW